MSENDSADQLQKKIRELEIQLAEAANKLQSSGIELEANEGLLKLMMDDMRRIYEDLLRSQSQLMQSDKLATIGLLTAGIVHEINNPLAAANLAFVLMENQVKKLTQFAEQTGAPVPAELKGVLKDSAAYVEQGKNCVETMARIVNDIRMFSRSDKGVMNSENVNKIIESVISIVWNSLRHEVKIQKEFDQLPAIRCNSQQLSQVFLNLIVNAAHAMKGRTGVITIRTAVRGGQVIVDISDTGCGMSKEVMDRIFEPFFTTKGAEEGTGLGLSITSDIIKKHSGTIAVQSEENKGTTFTISLPVS